MLEDGLYLDMGRHANEMAFRLRDGMAALGYTFPVPSPTNQQFPVLPNTVAKQLEEMGYAFEAQEMWMTPTPWSALSPAGPPLPRRWSSSSRTWPPASNRTSPKKTRLRPRLFYLAICFCSRPLTRTIVRVIVFIEQKFELLGGELYDRLDVLFCVDRRGIHDGAAVSSDQFH